MTVFAQAVGEFSQEHPTVRLVRRHVCPAWLQAPAGDEQPERLKTSQQRWSQSDRSSREGLKRRLTWETDSSRWFPQMLTSAREELSLRAAARASSPSVLMLLLLTDRLTEDGA